VTVAFLHNRSSVNITNASILFLYVQTYISYTCICKDPIITRAHCETLINKKLYYFNKRYFKLYRTSNAHSIREAFAMLSPYDDGLL
jgi:hypothetical protein